MLVEGAAEFRGGRLIEGLERRLADLRNARIGFRVASRSG